MADLGRDERQRLMRGQPRRLSLRWWSQIYTEGVPIRELDYAGLEGRLLSSSYIPQKGHPKHVPMLQALRRLFDEQQRSGHVVMPYHTRVYYGQLE